jgi:hypothetical protein
VCAIAAAALAAPVAASAQTALADADRAGLISAGAFAGMELDQPDNWLIFGADARLQVAHGVEVEPRFMYRPLDDGHVIQLDANVLKNFDLARPGRFRPFFGIGGALRSISPDQGSGKTDVGLNLISGTRIALSSSSGYEPFVIGQYSIIHDQTNAFSLVVGASFRLRQ